MFSSPILVYNWFLILSCSEMVDFPFNSTSQGIETGVPVLLVDGYNVCGYWPKLKKHFMSGRLDIARQKLIDELVTFSMLRGMCFAFKNKNHVHDIPFSFLRSMILQNAICSRMSIVEDVITC